MFAHILKTYFRRAKEKGNLRMSTLFEIGDDAAALDALLEEIGGDVSDPEAAAAIDEWLQETEGALETKLDGYAALIGERAAKAKARKEEAKRLTELARMDENMAARLKERLQFFFEEHGIEKKETSRFKIALAQNGGKLPLLIDDVSPDEIPDYYTKKELDRESIREALEGGMPLNFARLGERGMSLRIR
jgi:hypothetical protein